MVEPLFHISRFCADILYESDSPWVDQLGWVSLPLARVCARVALLDLVTVPPLAVRECRDATDAAKVFCVMRVRLFGPDTSPLPDHKSAQPRISHAK